MLIKVTDIPPWLNKSLSSSNILRTSPQWTEAILSHLNEHANVINTHLEVWPLALSGEPHSRSSAWFGQNWSWRVSRCRCSGVGRRYPAALCIYHLWPFCCKLPQCDKRVCLLVCGLQEPIGWQHNPHGTFSAGVMLQKENKHSKHGHLTASVREG